MTRYHGRHRKPTATGRTVAKIAVTGMVVGAPLTAFAGTASAASADQWAAVAQCESGGNPSINTGNGFAGAYQFTPSTWRAYGGQGAAQNASLSEQTAVAERVLAGQGKGAWPVCGTGLGAASPSSASAQSAPAQRTAPTQQQSTKAATKAAPQSVAPKAVAPKAVAPQSVAPKAVAPKAAAPRAATPKATVARTAPASTTATGSYTVQSGDTLAKIAAAQGVSGGYQAIFALNQDKVQNVNLIFPGQTLRLP